MTGLAKGELVLSALLVGLAVSGCATTEKRGDLLRKRAAFDLHCTRDELSVTRLDERTRGVTGCGRQATYLYTCERPNNAFDPGCSWVMNNRGREDDDDDSRPRRPVATHSSKRHQTDDDDQDQGSKPRQMQDDE
jgi:hypothetical protein